MGGSSTARLAARLVVASIWLSLSGAALAAEKRWVDVERSTVTVHLLAADSAPDATGFVLEAPLAEGSLDDIESPHLALVINLDQLKVVAPERSPAEREDALALLLGPEGLDAERFTRVTYHSLAIELEASGVWLVRGELELHGRFLPLDLRTRREGDRFTGSATVSPADFGVLPLLLPGSSDPVGHAVLVDFDVVLETP